MGSKGRLCRHAETKLAELFSILPDAAVKAGEGRGR